jgi:hypothetical protein
MLRASRREATMGLIQTFLNAFNKGREDAAKAEAKEKVELARNSGGTLGSTPQGSAGSFDPIQRPADQPESGDRVDSGNISVASGDPEEGGEATPDNPSVASGDPEEGGEVLKKKSDTASQINNNLK